MKNELECYKKYLDETDLASETKKLYYREAKNFLVYLKGREVNKRETIAYKEYLLKQGKKITSSNLYIVAVNHYLKSAGYEKCTIRTQRLQRRQCPDNILSLQEYQKMLSYAKESGRMKYYYIMRTLALTGIRVSELSGVTVEALSGGKFYISNKGKTREIYLPDKLIEELKNYCAGQNIKSGIIFMGNKRKPITRTAMYNMFQILADASGISLKKAHPHSFRHLFAMTYMEQYSNLFELADILGHSSLETTRIYTATTGEEKRRKMNTLNL